jgi:hypothetical protein
MTKTLKIKLTFNREKKNKEFLRTHDKLNAVFLSQFWGERFAEAEKSLKLVFVCENLKTLVAGQRKGFQCAGVEEFQKGLEDVGVGVVDDDHSGFGVNHSVVTEHGREDGTAGRNDKAMNCKRLAIDKELDVRQLLGLSGCQQLIRPRSIDQLEIEVRRSSGKCDVKCYVILIY